MSADEPAGRVKADLWSSHIGIEGAPNSFDDSRASLVVDLLENQTDGTEPRQITSQLLLGQRALDVDRADVDPGPAAFLQDAVDAIAIRECELPRRARAPRREVRQKRCRRALSGCHERILLSAPPDDQPQPCVVSCGTPQIGKGTDGVVKEHHTEARDDRIEASRLERVDLRVAADETHRRAFLFGARLSSGDHQTRDVDADRAGPGSEPPGDGECRAAGATADVQNVVRVERLAVELGTYGVGEQFFKRLEQPIERFLCVDPCTSRRTIPSSVLVVVST